MKGVDTSRMDDDNKQKQSEITEPIRVQLRGVARGQSQDDQKHSQEQQSDG